jgi:hypothetical protein
VDGVFDALVTAAAADVARHRFTYLVVGGFGILREKGGGLHDLAGLAVTALRHIDLTPSLLDGVVAGGMKAFDRRHFPAGRIGNGSDAGTYGLLVNDYGASAAQCLAAAEFRAG